MSHKFFFLNPFILAIPILVGLSLACKSQNETDVQVEWELVSNFSDNGEAFEAKFVLNNAGGRNLDDKNWALFFSLSPRPIIASLEEQAAQVEHLNGDWYRLSPNEGFQLPPDQSITISYWGRSGVIKETDDPLVLYFVYYDENGEEKEIIKVKDFKVLPYEREEQLIRGKADE